MGSEVAKKKTRTKGRACPLMPPLFRGLLFSITGRLLPTIIAKLKTVFSEIYWSRERERQRVFLPKTKQCWTLCSTPRWRWLCRENYCWLNGALKNRSHILVLNRG